MQDKLNTRMLPPSALISRIPNERKTELKESTCIAIFTFLAQHADFPCIHGTEEKNSR